MARHTVVPGSRVQVRIVPTALVLQLYTKIIQLYTSTGIQILYLYSRNNLPPGGILFE